MFKSHIFLKFFAGNENDEKPSAIKNSKEEEVYVNPFPNDADDPNFKNNSSSDSDDSE